MVIGTVFAWILGLGILLITLLATSPSVAPGVTTANTLFGSIYSLSTGASWLAAAIALAVTIAVAAVVRPLLLSTIDPSRRPRSGRPRAAARLGVLLALAVVTAESTQAVGALLLLGLLAAPAGAAHRLTAGPYAGLALSGLIAVGGDLGRPGARLRDPVAAAEQRDHRPRRRRVAIAP